MNKKGRYIISVILFLTALTVIGVMIVVASGKVLSGSETVSDEIVSMELETISDETSDSKIADSLDGDTGIVEEYDDSFEFEKDEAINNGLIIDDESYTITTITEERDRAFVEKNKIDLSGKKITVLGDSLTVGYPEEEIKGDNFPNALKEIFNCDVVNLGITGSMISHFHDREPMVERWNEIDKDSDIIIVYAGTNDMMIVKKDEFGDINTPDTFCYDLEVMLSEIAREYPDAIRILINPVVSDYCEAIHDMDPDGTLVQQPFSDIILERAQAHEYIIVDLYYTNLLNTNNRQVLDEYYLYDCLHMNPNGYHFLANHVAVEIIKAVNNR